MDNKLFHKLIRQQRGKLNRVIDELHVGDSVFKTDTEILIGWKNHFANLAKESGGPTYNPTVRSLVSKWFGFWPHITHVIVLTFKEIKHLSDYRTVGLSDRRTIGRSDYRTVGL
jgi:hypothetical protein